MIIFSIEPKKEAFSAPQVVVIRIRHHEVLEVHPVEHAVSQTPSAENRAGGARACVRVHVRAYQ
jgi:hypothetical protein